jgi:hypothetical protein
VAAAHGLSVEALTAMNQPELGAAPRLAAGQFLRVRPAAGNADGGRAEAALPFAAPVLLAPTDGATVNEDAPLLTWASAGILPEDVYYVVSLRDALATAAPAPELVWVGTNATALEVPARYRPAPRSSRTLAWTVTVRRSSDGRPGPGEGELLCELGPEQTFVWSP